MIFLRSTVFNLLFYSWTIFLAIVGIPFLLFSYKAACRIGNLWARGIAFFLTYICGIRVEIKGREYIKNEAVIYAVKHQSAWETIMFYVWCNYPVYVMKKELTYIPLFGWYLRAIRSVVVDRKKGASALRQMIRDIKARLAEDRPIIFFPEGTRVAYGKVKHLEAGMQAIATMTNATVIPVALNSGVCWGKNAWIKKPGVITILFQPPIDAAKHSAEFEAKLFEAINVLNKN